MSRPSAPLALSEFVALLALMISIVAMATDIMLPALGQIGRDLGVTDENDTQLVVSSLFLGLAAGQLLAGPLSDSFGRKPIICLGYTIFVLGCLMSIFAPSFEWMLVGRALQGLGAAGPRIVTMALVRDGYEGRAMARIMSFVMAVFILVPALAPAIGQVVIELSGWRATFWLLLGMAALAWIWFALRQPETLEREARRKFSIRNILGGLAEICAIRATVAYTLATGLIFGAFLGYLGSSRQVFQEAYTTGSDFPYYFGAAALAIGAASIVNASLVMRLGMRALSGWAIAGQTFLSLGFLIFVITSGGLPDFWIFMGWLLLVFFAMGILFGNLNALAMEPLGDMAGLGAALVGSVSTLISLPLGWLIGQGFDGGVTALVAGFAGLGLLAALVMLWAERRNAPA